jgi:hypothetical protein
MIQFITSDNTGSTPIRAVKAAGGIVSAWQHRLLLTQTFAIQVDTAALVMPHFPISPPLALIRINPYILWIRQ